MFFCNSATPPLTTQVLYIFLTLTQLLITPGTLDINIMLKLSKTSAFFPFHFLSIDNIT